MPGSPGARAGTRYSGSQGNKFVTHSHVRTLSAGVEQTGTTSVRACLILVGLREVTMRVSVSGRRITAITAVAVVVLGSLAIAPAASAATSDVFFSEYIEGSSNNKALEIFNGTGGPVDLAAGGYQVEMYFNGSATAGLTIPLTGTVTDGDVYVVAQASANATILAQADQTNGSGWFNGDDALVLRKGGAGGTVVDSIGQVGVDPGTEWGTGLT